jgi:O-succinylbenzoate synthase
MKIESIELHYLAIPFLNPFKYSSGSSEKHSCILVAVKSEGLVGWGECPTFDQPYYTYETMKTASHILRDFLVPSVLGKDLNSPEDLISYFQKVRGHPMAKAGLECAIWDLFAKARGIPLAKMLGGQRKRVKVGVAVPIEPTIAQLMDNIDRYVAQGYGRLKVKIAPDWHLEPLKAIRDRYSHLMLMADANSAFALEDVSLFQEMEQFNLTMIEQPLPHDDIWDHAQLQAQINIPICLDESIQSPHDAKLAIAIKACQIINLKVSRVGGINNTLAIHKICQDAGIKMWCGGMLESGVGRATNVHLATLPNFTFPGDISANERYFREDITEPYFYLNSEDSTLTVPTKPGIGVEVVGDRLAKFRQHYQQFTFPPA